MRRATTRGQRGPPRRRGTSAPPARSSVQRSARQPRRALQRRDDVEASPSQHEQRPFRHGLPAGDGRLPPGRDWSTQPTAHGEEPPRDLIPARDGVNAARRPPRPTGERARGAAGPHASAGAAASSQQAPAPTDGREAGAPVTTAIATVVNTAPVATVVGAPRGHPDHGQRRRPIPRPPRRRERRHLHQEIARRRLRLAPDRRHADLHARHHALRRRRAGSVRTRPRCRLAAATLSVSHTLRFPAAPNRSQPGAPDLRSPALPAARTPAAASSDTLENPRRA